MENNIYELKKIVYNLESKYFQGREIELLDQLIHIAQVMKEQYFQHTNNSKFYDQVEIEKISNEIFLYKPVMVRNYYEGDYLERFGETRTCDLKVCQLLDIHNQFWQAYEVQKGNIFASIPKEFADLSQVSKLESLGWDFVEVDVYEVKDCNLRKKDFMSYVEMTFPHHVIVREVYSDSKLILHYKI